MTIQYDEWLTEIERLRAERVNTNFTEEHKKLLLSARQNDNPVPWEALSKWWSEKIFKISASTLKRRYVEIAGE